MRWISLGKKIINRVVAFGVYVCMISGGIVLQVNADAIWEPSDDFYWNHARECEYVGADYLTNGKEGYVNLYREPNSEEVVATVKNGREFYVSFSFTDKKDKVWAVMSLWNFEPEEGEMLEEENMDAWIPMEEIVRVYNEADFRADYEDTFEEYTDEMKGYEIREAICLWEYPGSKKNKGRIESYMQPEDEPVYQHLYTDPDGRRWTYIGYYYGFRGWVCIDEPERNAPMVAEMQTKQNAMGIAGGAVATLGVVTAALIAVLFGKKKNNKGEE